MLLPSPLLQSSLTSFRRPLATFCQGLLLSGGGDFAPSFYDEPPHPQLGEVQVERDQWELTLIRKAYQEGIPILGICRGLQAINIAWGGSLYQDLTTQYLGAKEHKQSRPGDQVSHQIRLEESTLLFSLIGKKELWTNSHHHQAVKSLAPGLKISARSGDDGVIEGIEFAGAHFILGVQWHPERLLTAESHQLFTGFIRACQEMTDRKGCS